MGIPTSQQIRPAIRQNPAGVSVDHFREDPLHPKIVRVVDALLKNVKVDAPINVLVGMGLLEPKRVEEWRFGRVPCLERAIHGNLSRLSKLLGILRFHVHDLNLKPSLTASMRWGKRPKRRLRFSKTGDSGRKEAYATHLVWPGKGPFHPPESQAGREHEHEAAQSRSRKAACCATADGSRPASDGRLARRNLAPWLSSGLKRGVRSNTAAASSKRPSRQRRSP